MTAAERERRHGRPRAAITALVLAGVGVGVAIAAVWGDRVPRNMLRALVFFGCIAFVVVHNGYRLWRVLRSR